MSIQADIAKLPKRLIIIDLSLYYKMPMLNDSTMPSPRDVVKLAFHYQETEFVPYFFDFSGLPLEQEVALTKYYGSQDWKRQVIRYLDLFQFIDGYFSLNGISKQEDGSEKDSFGSSWIMGSTSHLVNWPLKETKIGDYRLPDIKKYFSQHIYPVLPAALERSQNSFRVSCLVFGLFERAWTLRGFENFLTDLALEERFAEELLDYITEWIIDGVDLLATAPIDAIMFTDDHAGQRGMLMGTGRWQKLFKPHWRRIYERVHHYGLYTIMHMCGNNSEVIPDLIEVGLDCMESCQPECMHLNELKSKYGKDIRFWGGLGAQTVMPFGTPEDVRTQTRKLKEQMGKNGGYILGLSKPPDVNVPVDNIAAFLKEANQTR